MPLTLSGGPLNFFRYNSAKNLAEGTSVVCLLQAFAKPFANSRRSHRPVIFSPSILKGLRLALSLHS